MYKSEFILTGERLRYESQSFIIPLLMAKIKDCLQRSWPEYNFIKNQFCEQEIRIGTNIIQLHFKDNLYWVTTNNEELHGLFKTIANINTDNYDIIVDDLFQISPNMNDRDAVKNMICKHLKSLPLLADFHNDIVWVQNPHDTDIETISINDYLFIELYDDLSISVGVHGYILHKNSLVGSAIWNECYDIFLYIFILNNLDSSVEEICNREVMYTIIEPPRKQPFLFNIELNLLLLFCAFYYALLAYAIL